MSQKNYGDGLVQCAWTWNGMHYAEYGLFQINGHIFPYKSYAGNHAHQLTNDYTQCEYDICDFFLRGGVFTLQNSTKPRQDLLVSFQRLHSLIFRKKGTLVFRFIFVCTLKFLRNQWIYWNSIERNILKFVSVERLSWTEQFCVWNLNL